jgi:hypothetical protein
MAKYKTTTKKDIVDTASNKEVKSALIDIKEDN